MNGVSAVGLRVPVTKFALDGSMERRLTIVVPRWLVRCAAYAL